MSYDDNDSDLVRDLRNQIEGKDKELKALRKSVEELQVFKVKVTVDDVIKEKGLNPKIKGLIPKDVEDVSAWLEEYGDLFGAATTANDDSAGDDDAGADAEVAELDSQVDSESRGAEDSGLLAKINATTDLAELEKLIKGG